MNRRDIELLISARDTTGRTFKQVTDNISLLNRTIDEQVAAAERGEVSLQDLRRTQEALAQAGRDLSGIQGQIDAYQKLAETQTKLGATGDKIKADLLAQKTAAEAAGTATAAQERKMASLEKRLAANSLAVVKNNADVTEQIAVLERAGIATNQLDTAQAGIVNSARSAGAGFVQLKGALDGYSTNLAKARDAEQQLAAQNGFDRKIAQARELGDAGRFVQLFGDAVTTLKSADNQLAALDGFRAVGMMAAEASRDVSRFVTEGQAFATSSSAVAAGLRAIVDPGNEVLRTLDGIENAIQQAGAVASAEKGNVGALSNALNDLSAASAAAVRQGGLIDGFERQAAATALVRQQFEQAQVKVQQLGAAMAAADVPTEALSNDLKVAESRLQEVGRALTIEETKLGESSRALKAAKIDTANLAIEQQRLTAAVTQAAAATSNANTVLGRGGVKTNGFLGLRPNDLQNLGFQVNDIFVSLASGQKPLTVLVQQGSQIAQIFPGAFSAVAKFAVGISGAVAVVTPFALGLFRATSEAKQLKDIINALNATELGAGLDPAKLSAAVDGLQNLGVAGKEAQTVVISLAESGLDPTKIDEYAVAAKNLSDRLGIDLVEAVSVFTDVQNGGIEAMFEAAEKTNALTAADIDYATALFESGRAGEARTFIVDKLREREAALAQQTQGVFTPAINNLRTAFTNLTNYLAKVYAAEIADVIKIQDDFIAGFTIISGLLAGKGFDASVAEAQTNRNRRGAARQTPGLSDRGIADRQLSRELDVEERGTRKLTAEDRRRNAVLDARLATQEKTTNQALVQRAEAVALAKVNKEIAAEGTRAGKAAGAASRRAQAARNKAARAGETAQNRRDSVQGQLTSELRSLDQATGRGSSATLEQRLAVIDSKYEKIFDTFKKIKALGLTTGADGRSLAAIEAEVVAAKDRLKSETEIKFQEDQINLLITQRKDEVAEIADKQERGALSVAGAYAEAEAVNARISPESVKAATRALEIARSIAGAKPPPEMVSLIAKLERISRGEGTNNIAGQIGLDGLGNQSAKLDALLKERDSLIQSYATLNELGVKSDAETRQLVAQAYTSQAAAIRPVVAEIQATVEALRLQKDALTGLPLITDAAYAAWQVKIAAVNAGLVQTDARIKQVNDAASQGIQQGVTNAFKVAGDSIANLILGTESFGDAINNVFTAALSLVGSFLSAIADVLIQMVALQAAKAILGAGSGGLGGLFFHEGGVVGNGGSSRKRTGGFGSWAGAPKFHSGGGLGLRQDEYKAVLKKGEEVLTEDDPRHIRNIGNDNGGGGGGGQPIRQVLALNPADIASAMQGRAGEKTFLTFIRTNKETVKQILG